MIYLIVPCGSVHGWGVCGKYLVKELSEITDIKCITEDFQLEDIGDEIEYHFLRTKLITPEEVTAITQGQLTEVSFPVLHAASNHDLTPWLVPMKGRVNIGYTFFETTSLPDACIQNGRTFYDTVVAGSTWCQEVLEDHGLSDVTTIIQGIDPQLFNPCQNEKAYFKDHFVIFSGGKFEYRKGQDVVIRACKILQDRHPDVLLVNSWYNIWADSMNTMTLSDHIRFTLREEDYLPLMQRTLAENGLDMNRVITLMPRPNAQMAKIYKNSDIGLFPNRCEGGTNLVLMEYMACGKPVVAANSSGHRDIINSKNAILIQNLSPVEIQVDEESRNTWDDPNLDETVAHLEWAYQHREALRAIGDQAGKDLSHCTWKDMARQFYEMLTR